MTDKLTIEELALASDVSTSTIRFYQQRSLIDPPTQQGRRAYYSEWHLTQLEEIAELSRHGFSLASIRVMRSTPDMTMGEFLRSETLDASEERIEMTLADLAAQVLEEGQIPDPSQFELSQRLGIVEMIDSGTVLVHSGALQLGREIRELGIARQTALDGHVAIRKLTDRIADILMTMYEERTDDVTDSGETYERFVDLACRTVEFAFLRSLAERRQRSRGPS